MREHEVREAVSATVWRAAIIGCGRKAATLDDEPRCRINYSIAPDTHAGAYQAAPSVRLIAAADPNASKRRLMQERYQVPAVYADYREMLASERPDLVSVTTRAPLHAEVTIAAAGAGVQGIICEKAMATSLREADAMIDACRHAGCVLLINHTRRWHPTYARAVDLLHAGAIGDLRCVIGVCPGPLIHNGTHLFDLMRMFAGEVEWVAGELRVGTPGSEASDDVPGRATMGFRSGVTGFVDLDATVGLALELQGASGRIFIDPAAEGLTLWTYSDAPAAGPQAWYQGRPCRDRTIQHVSTDDGRGTLIAAIEELIDCIESGREPRSSGDDGRAALELALAVYASHARGGERVALPLIDRNLAVGSR